MIVVDVNVIVYALRREFPQHDVAHAWLGQQLVGAEGVVISDAVLAAAVRLLTHHKVLAAPMTPSQALAAVEVIRAAPAVVNPAARESRWQQSTTWGCAPMTSQTHCWRRRLARWGHGWPRSTVGSAGSPGSRSSSRRSDPDCRAARSESTNMATLVAMTGDPQMALKDVKNRLSEVVDRVEREHDRVVITKHGRPAAVVVSVDDLASLEETLDIMAHPRLIAQIRDSLAELESEPAAALTKEQALELLNR